MNKELIEQLARKYYAENKQVYQPISPFQMGLIVSVTAEVERKLAVAEQVIDQIQDLIVEPSFGRYGRGWTHRAADISLLVLQYREKYPKDRLALPQTEQDGTLPDGHDTESELASLREKVEKCADEIVQIVEKANVDERHVYESPCLVCEVVDAIHPVAMQLKALKQEQG